MFWMRPQSARHEFVQLEFSLGMEEVMYIVISSLHGNCVSVEVSVPGQPELIFFPAPSGILPHRFGQTPGLATANNYIISAMTEFATDYSYVHTVRFI